MESSAAPNKPSPAISKKVFFLYPHSVIQEQMIGILVAAEYEVALVTSHDKAARLVEHFPSSILFCNIDDTHLPGDDWASYISGQIARQAETDVRIGVMTYNPEPEVAQKYLMEVGVSCGYIGLKLSLVESTKIILKTLEANEAKGGRRFVRVKCPPGKSIISLSLNGRLYKGNILDLSSAGIACVFQEEVKLKNGNVYDDIQLQLWGGILRVSMAVMGTRDQEGVGGVFVMMFETFADHESKGKLFSFIRKALQAEIDALP